MKSNIGIADRVIRIIIGAAIILWGVMAKSWWGAVGIVPFLTGMTGWCAFYQFKSRQCCLLSKKDQAPKDDKSKSCGCCNKH